MSGFEDGPDDLLRALEAALFASEEPLTCEWIEELETFDVLGLIQGWVVGDACRDVPTALGLAFEEKPALEKVV